MKLRSTATVSKAKEASFSALITDMEIAKTLIEIASHAEEGSVKRKRNIRNARHAYDTVKRLSERFSLNRAEQQELDQRLSRIKTALEGLGQHFKAEAT